MADKSLEQQIEELATLQFSDAEIATITELGVLELVRKYGSFIDRGRLFAEAEVRKAVLKNAKEGSPQAQKQFMEFNRQAKAVKRYKK